MSARGRRASSEDHQRPEEVEVLLDGERPEVVEVGEGPLPVLGDVDVDGVEPRPCLAVHQVVQRRPPQQRDQRGHEEDERQHAIVEREDAEEAPHVEVAEVVRLVVGVVEDAGDEEAGQDEEQLDAVGPVVGHADDGAFDPVGSAARCRRSGSSRTIRMARPRTPSSTGRCPRRLGRGLALAAVGSCVAGSTTASLSS